MGSIEGGAKSHHHGLGSFCCSNCIYIVWRPDIQEIGLEESGVELNESDI